MSCYVDPLIDYGWRMRGQIIPSCHLFTDGDIQELHDLAAQLGLSEKDLQISQSELPHYDLVFNLRKMAIERGAISVTFRQAVEIWKTARKASG